MTSRRSPTYKDIQRLTGLSLATISKHFNGRHVLDENRRRIEEAASQLGYRVNAHARGLRRGGTGTVGVLLPSLQNVFHLSVVIGVERRLRNVGTSIIVSSSDTDTDHASGQAVELMLGRRVDGIIAVPTEHDTAALSAATAAGVPVVAIDWEAGDLAADVVALDNVAAGELAARHLLDHGHRDVALIGGEDKISTMRDRRSGFVQGLGIAEADLPPLNNFHGPLTIASGQAGMNAMLSQRCRPTAVFAANHELTVGALISINESGLRLGQDISLLGFDSAEVAQICKPRLTIITQPVDRIAAEAARIMLDRLGVVGDTSGPREIVRLPAALLAGSSVAALHS